MCVMIFPFKTQKYSEIFSNFHCSMFYTPSPTPPTWWNCFIDFLDELDPSEHFLKNHKKKSGMGLPLVRFFLILPDFTRQIWESKSKFWEFPILFIYGDHVLCRDMHLRKKLCFWSQTIRDGKKPTLILKALTTHGFLNKWVFSQDFGLFKWVF